MQQCPEKEPARKCQKMQAPRKHPNQNCRKWWEQTKKHSYKARPISKNELWQG